MRSTRCQISTGLPQPHSRCLRTPASPTALALRLLGYDDLPLTPICFTVTDDHHVALDGVRVHRTKVMPPLDDVGVTPAGAFVGACPQERGIDVVAAGDWLLRHAHAHASREEIAELVAIARGGPARSARSRSCRR